MAVLRLITSSYLVGCLHRQVGRLLALEDAADIDARLAIHIRQIGAIAHQLAGRDGLTRSGDCGQRMAQSQSGNLFAPACEVRIGSNIERDGPLLDSSREGALDLVLGAGVDNDDLQPEAASRRLRALDFDLRHYRIVRIHEHGILVAVGVISCSNSSRFGPSSVLIKVIPVALPPGRLRLATTLQRRDRMRS